MSNETVRIIEEYTLVFSRLFCHDFLLKTIGWKPDESLVDVVKIIVDLINRSEFNRKTLAMVRVHQRPHQ